VRLGHYTFTSTLELEVLMGLDMEKTDDIQFLALKGALTIEYATELKSVLLEAIYMKDHLVLSLEEVTEVDLSGLQILCSAHRTSLEQHKQLTLQGARPGSFQQAVKDAGFIRSVGCHKDPHQKCLWVGGLE
jgi:anti-anti-sigma regulatory factor